ncbi:FxDxF family PEP-CTERM protein [Sphingomonas trueperi]|uniref:FxDxF family PEP-CTERM protein n=1 Tax=Sphingomonas trueperi TaxID=53317 RepID=UPI000EB1C60F
MKRYLAAVAAISAGLLGTTAAQAATTIITPSSQPKGTTFLVSGDPFSGPVAATFGHTGIAKGAFTDIFQFTLGQDGTGSGSVTTSVTKTGFLKFTDLDITSVVFNGITAASTLFDLGGNVCSTRGVGSCGASESFALTDAMVKAGVLNSITITGVSRGLGSYGSNATFDPSAVPEPASWGLMIGGIGAAGFSLRRRRSSSARRSIQTA